MNNTISSSGYAQHPLTSGSNDSASGTALSNNSTTTSTTSGTATSNDSVKLTDSAKAISQASSTDSPVDTARVDAIKKSLSAGTYQLDPNAIASNLTSIEGQLGATK